MLTQLTSFATIGLAGHKITVEIGTIPGEGGITIVGLGDTAVQESRQRVKLAIRASGYKLPTGRTITVNLAPADVKKAGPRFDLAIAIGLLAVHELITIPPDILKKTAVLGELALDGSIRHVSGAISAAIGCRDHGIETLVVPAANGPEAALVPGIRIIAVEHIQDLVAILTGVRAEDPVIQPMKKPLQRYVTDFADVRGQEHAKRALEIAAAGGHNVLLSGAPGSGKTLLARALRGILPPLTREEALEVTQIYSVANELPAEHPLITERPFRVIHHTASGVSIVGGGQIPGPGEISMAHKGVLFLDELAEFPAQVLEVLRQPLEDRRITITRANGTVTFPADVLLVAAMNPPQYGVGGEVKKFQRRISAPFLDRIDLTIDVQPVPIDDLRQAAPPSGDTTAAILSRVMAARDMQIKRFEGLKISTNKEMGIKEIRTFCMLDDTSEAVLKQAAERMQLSARGYHRIIKVARTIADLSQSNDITTAHIAEALQYRQHICINP